MSLNLIGLLKRSMNSGKTAGPFLTRINLYKKMMTEQIIPAVVAIITGGGFLFNRVHHRINDLDKRIDKVELRIAESYVSKNEFIRGLDSMEQHMIRIEEKLDKLVDKNTCNM